MDKFAMGGYGVYVWTCFGLTLAIVIINEWLARRRQRTEFRDVEVRIKAVEERQ